MEPNILQQLYNILYELILPYSGFITTILKLILYLAPILYISWRFQTQIQGRILRLFRWNYKIVDNISYSENEVVKESKAIRRYPLFGALLFVPQGSVAIIADPEKNGLSTYQAGERPILFKSLYASVKYVDIRRRTTTFSINKAITKDGFQISICGKITWRVRKEYVQSLTLLEDPIQEVLNEVEKNIRDVISTYEHNDIVPHNSKNHTGAREIVPDETLINRFKMVLSISELFKFLLHLNSIIITSRKGDPNREPAQSDPTNAEIWAKENEVMLKARKNLIDVEKELSIHELELEQELAKVKKIIRDNEIDLDIKREGRRYELERERLKIQAQQANISPILHIFSSYLNSLLSDKLAKKLETNPNILDFKTLVHELGNSQPDIITGEFETGPRPPKDAKERLTYKLVDLWKIENHTGNKVKELADGRIALLIYLASEIGTKSCVFVYKIKESEPIIDNIYLRNSKGKTFPVPNLDLFKTENLTEAIERLEKKYGSKKQVIEGEARWV